MRIILLADGNSLWTKRLYEEVYRPLGYEVTLAVENPLADRWRDYYAAAGVPVLVLPAQLPVIRWVRGLSGFVQRRREARFLLARGPFEQAHVQQMVSSWAALAWQLCRRGVPTVCSYWGSDVLRAGRRLLRRQRRLIAHARAVTVQSLGMRDTLAAAVGEDLREKIRICTFGNDLLPRLDEALALGRAECRRALGLPQDKYLVVLGGSASPTQQHLPALDALDGLPPQTKARLHLLLPLTYGGPEAYKARVIAKAEEIGVAHTAYTAFLPDEDMARLRVSPDLLVQAMITDSMSGAQRESLYAGVRVLNGAWLRYPELEALGAARETYADFAGLAQAVTRALQTEAPPPPDRAAFREACSWEAMRARFDTLCKG